MSKAIEKPIYEIEERPACESCGADDVSLKEYEDPGDPSVGYGPIIEVLCEKCAERVGAE